MIVNLLDGQVRALELNTQLQRRISCHEVFHKRLTTDEEGTYRLEVKSGDSGTILESIRDLRRDRVGGGLGFRGWSVILEFKKGSSIS